ncbi:cytochrome C [Geoalkalibacter halelectricus]|uniref:Cytochrome C n=1 Tax=Geoalkalibacter halelectricus TaxID=2847045 RepID=A0ABY5ZHB0_9BACT|nr:cytochrome C [Geoalkalibacter halelectricus]MDO3380147.1 cytochrome C [Geoalkalibacter halelectricus]UWZ78279.1 cytochrome C [Geoalkalibacter halelectricus]
MKNLLTLAATLGLVLLATATLADEGSCIGCHAGQPGKLGEEPIAQWRDSVHQRQGISCHSCHGGDPTLMTMEAMDPARGFIGSPDEEAVPAFCGRCHVGVEQDYRDSAHGLALGAGGPECVTCHGSHDVQIATIDLINPQDCSRCHEYGRAGELRNAMEQTEMKLVDLERQLRRLHRLGVDTDALQGSLFSLRNDFHRLLHSVDVDKVRRQTADYRLRAGEIQAQINQIRSELGKRKWVGAGVVVLLLGACLLFVLLHRNYQQMDEHLRRKKK